MAGNFFIQMEIKGKYKHNVKEGSLFFNLMKYGLYISSDYRIKGGRYGSSTGKCKILGFIVKKFDKEIIDVIVSFDTGKLQDGFYEELLAQPLEDSGDDIIMYSQDNSNSNQIVITSESKSLQLYKGKKDLTAGLSELLTKEEIKEYNANGKKLILLNKMFRNWSDLSTLQSMKEFKNEYLEDTNFLEGIIDYFDPEYNKKEIEEFKKFLK